MTVQSAGWLRRRWARVRRWCRIAVGAGTVADFLDGAPPAVGYRVPGIPTADEMAANGTRFAQELAEARDEIARLRVQLRGGAVALPAAASVGCTQAETLRLILLVEECGELQHAAAKVLRHGWDRKRPNGTLTNRVMLERELGHLYAAAGHMFDSGELRQREVAVWRQRQEDRDRQNGVARVRAAATVEETGTGQ